MRLEIRLPIVLSSLFVLLPIVGFSQGVAEIKEKKDTRCDGPSGFSCVFPDDCLIGEKIFVNCTTKKGCPNPISMTNVEAVCRFCWQLPERDYDCAPVTNCSTSSSKLFTTTCTTHNNIFCMGQRKFFKRVRCNWTSGYSWTTTMFLSIVFGGFGADRFYLGLWKSAIGKLLSFGGLGVWTIVDVVLVAVGYIKPSDGSLYI